MTLAQLFSCECFKILRTLFYRATLVAASVSIHTAIHNLNIHRTRQELSKGLEFGLVFLLYSASNIVEKLKVPWLLKSMKSHNFMHLVFALFRYVLVNFSPCSTPTRFQVFICTTICSVCFIQTPANGRIINVHINSRVYVVEKLV